MTRRFRIDVKTKVGAVRAFYLLLLLSFAFAIQPASSQVISSNFSKEYANQTINQAIAVLNDVNQSGYLVFYPNLTQAYADLNSSMALYNTSPAAAVVLANKAMYEATAQYDAIGRYRQVSIAVMLVLTAVFAVIIYRIMKPVRRPGGRPKRAKRLGL